MIVAFTAIYGSYDQPKAHPEHPAISSWVCFTDNPDLTAPGWRVVYAPLRYKHPRMGAKWWKCHPPNADASIWLDGSVALHNAEYIDMLLEGLMRSDLVMFQHPARDCIYDEVGASEPMVKYFGCDLRGQVARYQSQGWPAHNGLWATTTFARNHTPAVLAMGGAWFAHNELLTYQDQLSLPPLLADYGLNPDPIPGNLWGNPWFTLAPHRDEA
jgi:hypothetical protein